MPTPKHLPQYPLRIYHASPSKTPPHVLQGLRQSSMPTFHAGTLDAALERAAFQTKTTHDEHYEDLSEQGIADDNDGPDYEKYMHVYEIPSREHVSLATFGDPHAAGYDEERNPEHIEGWEVNQRRTDKANKYRNEWEDKGSTSFVVPAQLVRTGKIRHLSSTQFNTSMSAFDEHPETADSLDSFKIEAINELKENNPKENWGE